VQAERGELGGRLLVAAAHVPQAGEDLVPAAGQGLCGQPAETGAGPGHQDDPLLAHQLPPKAKWGDTPFLPQR
jgi:hypothetical protein